MNRNETEWEKTPGLAERPDADVEGPAGDGEEANSTQESDQSGGRWGACWGTRHKGTMGKNITLRIPPG